MIMEPIGEGKILKMGLTFCFFAIYDYIMINMQEVKNENIRAICRER